MTVSKLSVSPRPKKVKPAEVDAVAVEVAVVLLLMANAEADAVAEVAEAAVVVPKMAKNAPLVSNGPKRKERLSVPREEPRNLKVKTAPLASNGPKKKEKLSALSVEPREPKVVKLLKVVIVEAEVPEEAEAAAAVEIAMARDVPVKKEMATVSNGPKKSVKPSVPREEPRETMKVKTDRTVPAVEDAETVKTEKVKEPGVASPDVLREKKPPPSKEKPPLSKPKRPRSKSPLKKLRKSLTKTPFPASLTMNT
jgi:hypothetical protein